MDKSRILSLLCGMKLTGVLSLLALTAVSGHEKATPPTYSVTDLGPVNFATVVGMSNAGHVLINEQDRVLIYWTNGTGLIMDLNLSSGLSTACGFTPPFIGFVVSAGGISRNGRVVVSAAIGDIAGPVSPVCIAVFRTDTWTFQRTVDREGEAAGINNAGQVIGNLDANFVGFGPGCNFEQPAPAYQTSADAINDSGQIAGMSQVGAELCTAGVWQMLPNFGGGVNVAVDAINNKGEVVGDAIVSSGAVHGFLYRAGKTIDLGSLPGANGNTPNCMNLHGQIVGTSFTATGGTNFLYQDGAIHDLISLINPSDPYRNSIQLWATDLVGSSTCINDAGVIVSVGSFIGASDESHLFLLTPDSHATR